MGSYTTIADTSKTLVEFLKKQLVPEPVLKPEDIGLCSPDDRGGYALGLFLYNIEESSEVKNIEKIYIDKEHYRNPPTALSLYYMLFVRCESEVFVRAIDEQRILGRAIQVFADYPRIPSDELQGSLRDNDDVLDIQNIMLTFEEKHKVYSLFQEKGVLGFFYKAGPIFIRSDRVQKIKRVISADISIEQKNRNKGGGHH